MSGVTASELMRTDFVRLSADAPVGEAIDLLLETRRAGNRPAIAVAMNGERFEGFFTLMSALDALMSEAEPAPAAAVPVPSPAAADSADDAKSCSSVLVAAPALAPRDGLEHTISNVIASKADAAPVIENGVLLGVVFLSDLFDRIAEKVLVGVVFEPQA